MDQGFIAISEMSRKTKPTLTYYGVARHEEERIKQLYPKYYRQVYL